MLSNEDLAHLIVKDSRMGNIYNKNLLNNRIYHLSSWCKGERSKISDDNSQVGSSPSNRHYFEVDLENNKDIWK